MAKKRERRSGTQDIVGAVGLATALRLADAERVWATKFVGALRDALADGLLAAIRGVHRTIAVSVPTLPGHLHLCFEGLEREDLLVVFGRAGLSASGGSSSASGALEQSAVLAAMGVDTELARGAIRFTLGHDTTEADVARALSLVPTLVQTLRDGH